MSHSKNWIAEAIPSIDGSTTTLKVQGDVPSGIVAPSLVISQTQTKLPEIAIGLELKNEAPGGRITRVDLEHDITGKDEVKIVLVFDEDQKLIAAMIIDRTIVS